jgi:hypothetical protein
MQKKDQEIKTHLWIATIEKQKELCQLLRKYNDRE